MDIQPVILSGGSGTRLWPLSREQYPKQLLNLLGDESLLQQTITRLHGLEKQASAANLHLCSPIVVCNEQHRFLVAEQLRKIGIKPAQIILEPSGRNTAPALTLAALCREKINQDAVLLVMPADHVIADKEALYHGITVGSELANRQGLVTFGIVPTQAETGYGYIRIGGRVPLSQAHAKAYTIAEFVEKPDAEVAQAYVTSGEYLWNSGMFMMKASTWLSAINAERPDIFAACAQALATGKTDLDFFRAGDAAFAACPGDSIDYAVMEKMACLDVDRLKEGEIFGCVVPLDAGWSDVGAWSSLWEVAARDESGNVCSGDVLIHDTSNSYIHAETRLVAAVGLENIVVVETADAVMVANKANAQDVKHIVAMLKSQGRDERLVHRQVFRPWGSYEGVVSGPRFQVKRIEVTPGASLSLQMHHHRAEHWIVVSGTARVTRGDETFLLTENQSTYIPLGTIHRLENPGTLTLEIIEVQSGSYLGEDDIVRFEDNYGRTEKRPA